MGLTINDVETSMQRGLEALRNAPLNEQICFTLKYLLPEGYRPIIQFEEEGRKKRSTASADTWNPATGEIVIYFEPIESGEVVRSITASPQLPQAEKIYKKIAEAPQISASALPSQATEPLQPLSERPVADDDAAMPVTNQEVLECCQALANAEKTGKHFIALKWFRDEFLPTIQPGWSQSAPRRQLVLTETIESGKIGTKKIPNPKMPQFPTTTVSLNRETPIDGVAPR